MSALAATLAGAAGVALAPVIGRVIDRAPTAAPLVRGGPAESAAGRPVAVVAVAHGGLWALAGLRFGISWLLVPYLFLFSVLLVQAVIDLVHYRLPDRVTVPALGVTAVIVPVAALLDGDAGALVGAAVGSAAYFLCLLVPSLISPRGMGLGDVKLAVLMGAYLGWIDPILVLHAVLIACAAGVAAGAVLYFSRGRKNQPYPFGPWLAFGCVVAVSGSEALLG